MPSERARSDETASLQGRHNADVAVRVSRFTTPFLKGVTYSVTPSKVVFHRFCQGTIFRRILHDGKINPKLELREYYPDAGARIAPIRRYPA